MARWRNRISWAAGVWVFVAAAVAGVAAGHQTADSALTAAIRQRIDSVDLEALYRPAQYQPIWSDARGVTPAARAALALIDDAAAEALEPESYDASRLRSLSQQPSGGAARADFDVTLSRGMLRYVHDLHSGRVDPRTIGFRLMAPTDRHDFPSMLLAAARSGHVVDLAKELRPPLAQYGLLKRALAGYRALMKQPPVDPPPVPRTAVHPGDPYAGAGAVAKELARVGDLGADAAASVDPTRYDDVLVEGVRRFQRRHGIDDDGVIGVRTAAALRVPLVWRVRQLELALERLRWLPHLGDERLIVLNIPMFRLWAWNAVPPGSAPVFGMDAIVGRALTTQTPVFIGEMQEVVFRPYWNVPRSILVKEVLPAIRKDPNYLKKQDMEIVHGDRDDAPAVEATSEEIARLGRGPARVRQRPGPGNALGLIKFVFPNEESVFMHGTPATQLFRKSRRDFSHGCVRVADPVALAEWVLAGTDGWTRDRIVSATAASASLRVRLNDPVRVVLFYTTAVVMPEDGSVHFADDIYRHDPRLDAALARASADR